MEGGSSRYGRGDAPGLRGRSGELARIDETLAAVAAGQGRVVLVEGPPGIGKSRLLAEVEAKARDREMSVGFSRADEVHAVAPLTPLLAALSASGSPILRRDELLALERPGDQRFWLLEDLADLLERRCRSAPIMVVLDDVHWADEATTWAVAALTQRLRPSPVGWVLAFRGGELERPTARLVESLVQDDALRIRLQPMTASDLEHIAAEMLGADPDSSLAALLAGAGGNPFLGIDLVRRLVADDSISIRDGEARVEAAARSESLSVGTSRWLSRLSVDTTRFLQAAAVFGRAFTVSDVAALMDIAATALLDPVEECVRTEILDDVDDRLMFRHDLLRQAILNELPKASRAALHRRAADVVLSRDGHPTEAAAHLLRWAEPGDAAAVGVLFHAAGSVAATAPGAAADLAKRAVELMSPTDPGWLEALVGTVRLLAWATRFGEATDLAQQALSRRLDPMSDGLVRIGVSDTLLLAARRVDLIEHAQESLTRPDLPSHLRGHFLHNLAQGLGQDGQVDAAERSFRAAIDLVEPSDTSLVLSCRTGLALMTAWRGDLTSALAMEEQNIAACDEAGPEAQQRMPLLPKAAMLTALDQLDEADAVVEEARLLAQHLGATWAVEFADRVRLSNRWSRGRIAEAAVDAEALLAMAEAVGLSHDSDRPIGVLGLAAFHSNDLAAARGWVQRAIESHSRFSRATPSLSWRFVEALLIDAAGSPRDAIVGLFEVYDRPDALTAALVYDHPHAPALVRLALRAGDRAHANTVVAASAAVARANPESIGHTASARQALGLLDGDADELVSAATLYRDNPRLLARASAFEDAGQALQGRDRRDEGVALLTDALELYSEIGAARDEARARARLREVGVRRRSTAPPSSIGHGWASITPAERRVVDLVVEGRTNREIAERLYVSPYTVGTHLKHVFTKLGVSSRVELVQQHALASVPSA